MTIHTSRTVDPAPLVTLDSVDERLGDAGKRFFGTGFRRVGYDITDVRTTVQADVVELTARLAVRYPGDWSAKRADRSLRPHLSSLDAMILSFAAAQFATAIGYDLDPGDAEDAMLLDMRVAAGNAPTEDLSDLEITLRAQALPDGCVTFDCRVATMRVRGTLTHPGAGDLKAGDYRHDQLDSVLGPPDGRYYADGFRTRRQDISEIEIDPVTATATATLCAEDDAAPGAEPTSYPVTEVDLFVTGLQLAQLMLYDMDGLSRAESETLWMRNIRITIDPAYRRTGGPAPVSTELRDARVVLMAENRWRTADIVATAGGISLRVAVTHKLPDVAGAGAPVSHVTT